MSKSAISLSILSLIFLAGCQTTNNGWSDWEGIPYDEATLEWKSEIPTDLYARKVSYSGTYQEQWDWETGVIFVTKAGFARHYEITIGPKEFGDHMADWKIFKASGPLISASEVKETKNKYGKFYYAGLKNNDGEDCLAFMQAIKKSTPAGYIDQGQPTGFLMGYDCGDNRFTNSEVLALARSITYR